MGKVPLVAKVGENVELTIARPAATAPHSPPASPWHLPYWSGDYEVVISPPWLIALAMIALGLTILIYSACKTLRKRKSAVLGDKTKVRLNSYPPLRIFSCNMV